MYHVFSCNSEKPVPELYLVVSKCLPAKQVEVVSLSESQRVLVSFFYK